MRTKPNGKYSTTTALYPRPYKQILIMWMKNFQSKTFLIFFFRCTFKVLRYHKVSILIIVLKVISSLGRILNLKKVRKMLKLTSTIKHDLQKIV